MSFARGIKIIEPLPTQAKSFREIVLGQLDAIPFRIPAFIASFHA
jgi:hypothetical protein